MRTFPLLLPLTTVENVAVDKRGTAVMATMVWCSEAGYFGFFH